MSNILRELESYNLLKYTDHYVLTINTGGGPPIIFQGADLDSVLRDVEDYHERVKKAGVRHDKRIQNYFEKKRQH